MESRLSKHHAYRPRKRMRPDPAPAKANKAVASRFYQLRTDPDTSELFVKEKYSPDVLDFLRSTGVGRTVPREGEDGGED